MRILTVVHDYLPAHIAGTELHAHQTGAELARRGHVVTALFTERDLSAAEGSVREGELDSVRTLEVVHQREYSDVRESFLEERSLAWFRTALERVRPDVVHFHHFAYFGARCAEVAREARVPVVATLHDYHLLCANSILLHGDGSLCEPGPCHECLEGHPLHPARQSVRDADRARAFADAMGERRTIHARVLSRVDRVICPSRFLAERFLAEGWLEESRVSVMKAGYPGPRRTARRSDPAAPLRVGYVGGVYAAKGVHVLIEAFEHLAGLPVRLDVFGVLDWFPEYVAGLRLRAAGKPIAFRGRFEPTDIDRVLAEIDVLVVPSLWYENMPITIQEAFRNSIPVVATDLGGMGEAVEHGVSGLLFPRGDARALADHLARLSRDRELLFALASGTPAPPSLEEIVSELEALYRELQPIR